MIARFPSVAKAHIARGRLEAEGIPAVVIDERSPKVLPGILVPAEKVEEAAKILDTLPGLFRWWSDEEGERKGYEPG